MAVQSAFFTTIAMVIARIIAQWGPLPIAVQKVGSQIESISWLTAGGFQTAMSAFIGQNYGAKKWDRVYKGYFVGIGIVSVLGVFATFLLIFGAGPIFAIFIPEPEAISQGVVYLKILGLSQLGCASRLLPRELLSATARVSLPQSSALFSTSLGFRERCFCQLPSWLRRDLVGNQHFQYFQRIGPESVASAVSQRPIRKSAACA